MSRSTRRIGPTITTRAPFISVCNSAGYVEFPEPIVRFKLSLCYVPAGSQGVSSFSEPICLGAQHDRSFDPPRSGAQSKEAGPQSRKDRGAGCQSAAFPAEQEFTSISDAQLAANRSNAQLSTGPTSDTGKAKTSLNAVKTGLTGRTVLLPTDDAAEYRHHIETYEKEFHPVGQRECDLVQSIANTQWRLLRIPSLESGIYALGHLEFKDAFEEHDPSLRHGMIEVRTFLTYERQLRNLHLQESRLQRRREKEIAELRALQEDRKTEEAGSLEARLAQMSQPTAPEPENGFVFSTGKASQSLSPALPAASIAAPGIQPQTCAA